MKSEHDDHDNNKNVIFTYTNLRFDCRQNITKSKVKTELHPKHYIGLKSHFIHFLNRYYY